MFINKTINKNTAIIFLICYIVVGTFFAFLAGSFFDIEYSAEWIFSMALQWPLIILGAVAFVNFSGSSSQLLFTIALEIIILILIIKFSRFLSNKFDKNIE